jgi:kynurenine formamidase
VLIDDEEPLQPWRPPTYSVDGNGKVIGARPGTPNNWGRWGPLDQIGTLNLLTPEKVAEGASLVRTGERFSLALPIGRGVGNPGSRPEPLHLFAATTSDWLLGDLGKSRIQYSDDVVIMSLQASTQIDGLAHIGSNDTLYNGYWAGLVTASSGARRLGIHHAVTGVVGRAVLLDVAADYAGECPSRITPDILDDVARRQKTDVRAGDIVLIRTGYLQRWLTTGNVGTVQPGVTPEVADWLSDRDIAFLGADNRAVEVLPSGSDDVVPFHVRALRDLGMPLGELIYLDDLALACWASGVFEFFFVASILPIRCAVGSPINPIALR